jgi:TM2 domain-containing membrane protein YozV
MEDHPLPRLGSAPRRLHIDASDLPPAALAPGAAAPVPPTLWAGHAAHADMPASPPPAAPAPPPAKGAVLGAARCANCSSVIDPRAVACPACGLPTATAYAGQVATAVIGMNQKSSGVALLLSLLWPGAGQIYLGRIGAGAGFMVGSLAAFMLIFLVVGILLYPAVLIWAMVDAYRGAEEHNRRLLQGGAPGAGGFVAGPRL